MCPQIKCIPKVIYVVTLTCDRFEDCSPYKSCQVENKQARFYSIVLPDVFYILFPYCTSRENSAIPDDAGKWKNF